MIAGIGVDIVSIERLEDVLARWGRRFEERVFTPAEAESCRKRTYPPSPFALRFAAKEAFSKALGVGMKQGLAWRDIEVFHHPGGRPGLRLHGRALALCRDLGIAVAHLSLSDDGDYGIAMVVLERSHEDRHGI